METLSRTLHAVLVFFLCFLFGFSSAQTGIPDGAASLVFVFDTTGSMYDDLIQVRAGASKILSTTLDRKVKPLYNYVLIPFHDPGELRNECYSEIIHSFKELLQDEDFYLCIIFFTARLC